MLRRSRAGGPKDRQAAGMPLLEEVGEGAAADESLPGEAESLKAEHRRRRASKARKKKRAEVRSDTGESKTEILALEAPECL